MTIAMDSNPLYCATNRNDAQFYRKNGDIQLSEQQRHTT